MLGLPPEKPIRLTSILMLHLHPLFCSLCCLSNSTKNWGFLLWISAAGMAVGMTLVFGVLPCLFRHLRYSLRHLVIEPGLVFSFCRVLPSDSDIFTAFSNVASTSPRVLMGFASYGLAEWDLWKWTWSLSTRSVRQPASTSIKALPVAKNGHPRISGTSLSSPISNTTKSTE